MLNPKGKWGRKVVMGAAVAAGLMSIAGPAFASTTAKGTEGLTLSAGTLSVSSVTSGTLAGTVAGTATGTLPSAVFSDTTGSGNGWNATIALSTFNYTGSWTAAANTSTGSTSSALAATTSGIYTGTNDGDTYKVTVTAASSTSVSAKWTSTYNTTGASVTATPGTKIELGSNGVTIDFSTTQAVGDSYTLFVGNQPASAVSLDTAVTGAGATALGTTTSPVPTLVNTGTTVTGGGAGTLGTSVKVVSAATGTGMGSYTVVPGAEAATDSASWAQTYTANAQYSIVTGP